MIEINFPAWSLPLIVIAVSALATYASRLLGVVFSGRIRPDSELLEWVICVTYALLAGLVVRMIMLPIGALAEISSTSRFAAVMVGMAAFWIAKRNLGLGVTAGTLVLMILAWI